METWENLLDVCFKDHFLREILLNIDFVDVIQKLSKLQYISQKQRKDLSQIIRSLKRGKEFVRKDEPKIFIHIVAREVTVEEFIEALFKAKYHESALHLETERRRCVPRFATRATEVGPGFVLAQKLYLATKRNIQNHAFKSNPTETCQTLYKECKLKFEECEAKLHDISTRGEEKETLSLRLTEQVTYCTSYLFAALDSEITRWNTDFSWPCSSKCPKTKLEQLLNEICPYIYKTPNPKIAEVGFFSRIAIAFAMSGQLAKADEYIESAFASSVFIPHCAELEFMLHMYVMILLFKYQKDPTIISLEKLSNIAEIGLRILQDETDDSVRYFWMRMIILRKVFSLLGISNNMEIIKGCRCTAEQINQAEELLVYIRRMGEMESRREMFFYMAKARISELQNDLDDSIEFAEFAISCDEYGCFGETENVNRYLYNLKQTVKRSETKEAKTPVEHEDTNYRQIENCSLCECTDQSLKLLHKSSQNTIPKLID